MALGSSRGRPLRREASPGWTVVVVGGGGVVVGARVVLVVEVVVVSTASGSLEQAATISPSAINQEIVDRIAAMV
jgi:hypothetical protein